MEFRHTCVIVPNVSTEDKVMNSIVKVKHELLEIQTPSKNFQLEDIQKILDLYTQCREKEIM